MAVQCIASAFGLDTTSPEQQAQFGVPFDLPDIYNFGLIHLAQTQQIQAPSAEAPAAAKPTTATDSEMPTELEGKFQTFLQVLEGKNFFAGFAKDSNEYRQRYNLAKQRFLSQFCGSTTTTRTLTKPAHVSDAKLEEAEQFKALGNEKMSAGQPVEAVQLYNQAIALNPNNPVYFGNRAAAHSTLQQHEQAISDCRRAIALDSKYLKAYSRLGFSLFSLGKFSEAIEQGYNKVLDIDPQNAAALESIRLCQQKLESSEAQPAQDGPGNIPNMPNMPNLASMMSNPGVMDTMRQMFSSEENTPDISSFLGNPQFMNMAQQMMGSPQFSQILNNPTFMNMAENLMQNPAQLNQMFSQMGRENEDADQKE